MNLSTNKSDLLFFAEILAYLPPSTGYLKAMELRDPRSEPPDNAPSIERLRFIERNKLKILLSERHPPPLILPGYHTLNQAGLFL